MSVDAGSDPYQAKADFGEVYNQPDPRSYYRTVGSLVLQSRFVIIQAFCLVRTECIS